MGRDLYRDTPVRYLGYANEVGEAFRAFIGPRMVNASYGVATLYVAADTFDKSTTAYSRTGSVVRSLTTAGDTLIWQMLASVIIPGFAINRTCAFSSLLLAKHTTIPANRRMWMVTGIGLAMIPFIIKPIDHLVDTIMNLTYRKIF